MLGLFQLVVEEVVVYQIHLMILPKQKSFMIHPLIVDMKLLQIERVVHLIMDMILLQIMVSYILVDVILLQIERVVYLIMDMILLQTERVLYLIMDLILLQIQIVVHLKVHRRVYQMHHQFLIIAKYLL